MNEENKIEKANKLIGEELLDGLEDLRRNRKLSKPSELHRSTRRDSRPYYSKAFGDWVRSRIIDVIQAKGINNDFRIHARGMHMSPVTLKNRINQGWTWLLDNEPDENTRLDYLTLKMSLTIGIEGAYVALRWKKESRDIRGVTLEAIPRDKNPAWRTKLAAYLEEGDEDEVYEEKSVNLSKEDVQWIKDTCYLAETVGVVNISRKNFLISKNPEVIDGFRSQYEDDME